MNEIVKNKFMPEMHLTQPGFTYSVGGPFTINEERIKKIKETGDSRNIYQNKLDKGCFQDDMAYGDFKDLTRRTVSDKILHDKAFNNAKNLKYNGCQRGLASIIYKFFDKKYLAVVLNMEMSDQELGEELRKLIIRKFKK